jgi:hypothetical protein
MPERILDLAFSRWSEIDILQHASPILCGHYGVEAGRALGVEWGASIGQELTHVDCQRYPAMQQQQQDKHAI